MSSPELKDQKLVSTSTFDFVRTCAELGFPALIAFYIAVSEAWSWAYQTEITATLVAVNVLLGVAVKILRYKYDHSLQKFDGTMHYNLEDPEKSVFALEFDVNPGNIPDMKELRLNVKRDQ